MRNVMIPGEKFIIIILSLRFFHGMRGIIKCQKPIYLYILEIFNDLSCTYIIYYISLCGFQLGFIIAIHSITLI